MARRRRVSARELERRLVKRLGYATLEDVENVVDRLRMYAIARHFDCYVSMAGLASKRSASALDQGTIEHAIRERMKF